MGVGGLKSRWTHMRQYAHLYLVSCMRSEAADIRRAYRLPQELVATKGMVLGTTSPGLREALINVPPLQRGGAARTLPASSR
jgi:hypothetical protein